MYVQFIVAVLQQTGEVCECMRARPMCVVQDAVCVIAAVQRIVTYRHWQGSSEAKLLLLSSVRTCRVLPIALPHHRLRSHCTCVYET
jgi:hypothetical protein